VHLGYGNTQLSDRETEEKLTEARSAYMQVKQGATVTKTKHDFYDSACQSGYTFGPSFKAMEELAFSDERGPQAIATVKPFVWEAVDDHNHFQPHIVHLTTLDGILQISLAAFSRAGLHIVPTAIPTEIDHLWISTSGLSYPHTDFVRTRGTFVEQGLIGYGTSVVALDSSSPKIVLEAKGIRLRFVTGASSDKEQHHQFNTCHTVMWHPDIDLLGKETESTGLSTALSELT
jgi:hypothetical protein